MTDRLHLQARHREQLEELFREHLPEVEVWAYGSRVDGRSHDGSDLDLVLRGPGLEEIDLARLDDFRRALHDSTIPFLVEARDWARLPERFHREVEREYLVLRETNEWRDCTWGDLASLEYGKALRGYREGTGPYRVFGTNGPIGRHEKALHRGPGVIVGRKGAYRGVHYSSDPFFVIDTAFFLKPTSADLDMRWAYYQLLSQDINGMDSGSAIPSTTRESFYALPLRLPPVADQRAIAHILGTLDDKIDLNRRMNETLEAMARALFRSWFVDFDPVRARMEGRETGLPKDIAELFPDRLVDSEMGEIPEGWEVASLGDVALCDKEGVDPANEADDTPYIGLADMPRGSIALTHWSRAGRASSRKSAFKIGDVLFGKLRPYFHKVGIAPVAGLCSTDILVLRSRQPQWSAFVLACVSSSELVAHTSQTVTGTRMPRTSWKAMSQYELSRPPDTVASEFQRLVSPLLAQIVGAVHESRTLAALRDTLLPKLVSGEIRVRDAENLGESPASAPRAPLADTATPHELTGPGQWR